MVAVAGSDRLIEDLAEAVDSPKFPLYLGRRSSPAPVDLFAGVAQGDDPETALRDLVSAPWLASDWYRKECAQRVHLPLARDARPGEAGETVQDVPVSFDPRHRTYAARGVVRPAPVTVDNPMGQVEADPFLQTVKEG